MLRMIALALLLGILADPLLAADETMLHRFSTPFDLASGDAPQKPQDGFADGLMGGPDFWEVKGLVAGKTVNIRRAPSGAAAIVGKLS